MKKKKRESRLRPAQAVASLLGISLFEDTRIQRIVVIGAHFTAVGVPGLAIDDRDIDFPLAGLDQPDVSNATVMIVVVRRHPGEPMTGAYDFRYHHRDSDPPERDLDLVRCRQFCLDDHTDLDKWIDRLVAVLPVTEGPEILDASDLDLTEAYNAYQTMPFAFVEAPDQLARRH